MPLETAVTLAPASLAMLMRLKNGVLPYSTEQLDEVPVIRALKREGLVHATLPRLGLNGASGSLTVDRVTPKGLDTLHKALHQV